MKAFAVEVVGEAGQFRHIHPTPALVIANRANVEPVRPVTVTPDKRGQFWGWEPTETPGRFVHIYPYRYFVDVCLPLGIQAAENAQQGRALRLSVTPRAQGGKKP